MIGSICIGIVALLALNEVLDLLNVYIQMRQLRKGPFL